MKTLKISLLYNNVHFYVIPIILSALIFYSYIFIFILAIYLLIMYKFNIYFKISLYISILTFIFYMLIFNIHTNSSNFSGYVVDVVDNSYVVKRTFDYILVYSDETLEVGNKVSIKGKVVKTSSESYSGGFNYTNYLKYKKINYVVSAYDIEVTGNKVSLYTINNDISSYFSSRLDSLTFKYFSTLILGNNILSDEVYNDTQLLGISHIFSLSGFHVNIFCMLVLYLLNLFIINENKKFMLLNIILFIYMGICNFSISVLRAGVMVILNNLFKIFNLKFSQLDCMFLSVIIVLIYNPYSLYLPSFYLTYLLAFVIMTFDFKKGLFSINLICFLVSLPIIINLSNTVNLLTIIIGPLFILLITYLILPILYISIIYHHNYNHIFVVFENIVSNDSLSRFIIHTKDINIVFIILYYIILFYLFIKVENRKKLIGVCLLYICYTLFLLNLNTFRLYDLITFIDVGQGDSSLISLNHGKTNILIDSFSYNDSYLKDLGVSTLDYMIITHNHSDHNNISILEEFNINSIITSKYDVMYNNQMRVEPLDTINIDNIKIEFLYPFKSSLNENNESLVFIVYINNYKILYTGDIEKEDEAYLVNEYASKLDCDILKVGHHGSNTSSTKEFINLVSPTYSIISVGVDNKYGMPSNSVLNTLSGSEIYMTSINKNIDFLFIGDKVIARPYKK